MTRAACPACRGDGIGRVIFHGYEADGSECLEHIKCDECDGIGLVPNHYEDAVRAANAPRERRAAANAKPDDSPNPSRA